MFIKHLQYIQYIYYRYKILEYVYIYILYYVCISFSHFYWNGSSWNGAEDLHQLQESWYHLSAGEQSSLLRHFLADGVVNQAIVFEWRSCREDKRGRPGNARKIRLMIMTVGLELGELWIICEFVDDLWLFATCGICYIIF